MSCEELERLFVADSPEALAREHAESCPTCAAAERDQNSIRRLLSALQPPAGGPALREALLAIPSRTVDCETATILIAAAIDGEVQTGDRRRLGFHLSRCAACSEASETLGGVRELIPPQPGPWFAGRLAASARFRGKPAARERRPWLPGPKAAIGFAYAAALVLMLAGFNPADLARKARTELPQEAKVVAGAASMTLADRAGALGEKVLRAALVVRSRAVGYGRAALSNAAALVLKSEPAPARSRSRKDEEKSTLPKNETAITTWRT